MKIGIIGAGNVANAHAKAIQRVSGIDVAGVYDLDITKAQKIADFSQSKVCTTSMEVYDLVDAVIICTPNHTHFKYVVEALEHEKHILCEKPLATSNEQALEMYHRSLKSSTITALGFNYRFLPIVREIEKLILSDSLGELLWLSISFKRSSALTRKTFTWRDSAQGNSTSGAFGDLGSHLIDLLTYITKTNYELNSLKSRLATYVSHKDNQLVQVDDDARVNGRLENGTYFQINASKTSPIEENGLFIEVHGSKGELQYDSRDRSYYSLKSGLNWDIIPVEENEKNPQEQKREVPGWSSSFVSQIKAWRDRMINQESKTSTMLADFGDGVYVQSVLSQVLAETQYSLLRDKKSEGRLLKNF